MQFFLTLQCLLTSVIFFGSEFSSLILSDAVIGYPASSDECDENKLLDHGITE